MKNLVSRNPVLRFKEGKKIIFAETGIKTSAPTRGTKFGDWMRKQTSKGFVWLNSKDNSIIQPGLEILVDGLYLKGNGTYTSASLRNKKNENVTGTSSKTNNFDKIRQSANDYANKLLKSNPTNNRVSNRVSTSRRPLKTQEQWNNEFANNFTNTLTQAQRQYLDSKGVNYTNASDVQKFLMDLLQTNLGGFKNDGKWGKNSILAWKDFVANNIPENFDLLRNQETMTIGNKPYVEQPTIPAPTLGYRTGNTYEENDFSNRMKSMGIKSNADLIDFMHRTNGENFNWNGDDWARQFRSDVNLALGGDYSDANIRKTFNTSGNWGKGFLGRGDIGDFQNALQTNAGIWNGKYDAKVGNLVKNIDWSKFKLYKQGGQLPSRNIVEKKFLVGGPVTTLKTGGLIPIYKNTPGPIRQNDKYKTKLFGDKKREQALKEFADKGVEFVKNTTQPMQLHTAKANKRNKNIAALLLLLWNSGAFKGVIDKRTGKQVTYERAVDGYDGKMTRQALDNYLKIRESIQINSPQQLNNQKSKGGLASLYEMTHAALTGGMSTIPTNSSTSPALEANGHAIYLHYPNFIGNSKNAFKIGDFDPGEVVGNPQLPVGHAATILIDDKGNANYYEYGRYEPSNGHLIGTEQRATVKGGNWRLFKLPKQKAGENDSVYISRILKMLPDTKTGAYQAMTIPSVDVRRATEFILNEANNKNRKEYGIFNTCATGACNATLDFRKDKLNNKEHADNRTGYSEAALSWARLPFTTDSYATKARKAASKVYIMNN